MFLFLAILCLVLPEIQALKQVSSFLVQFISQSRETSLAQVIQAYGESLVLRILMNLGKIKLVYFVLFPLIFILNIAYVIIS